MNVFVGILHLLSGPSGGDLWPTQLTHGSIIAFRKEGDKTVWKMTTALEHMCALGWRMHFDSRLFPVSKMRYAIKSLGLSPHQVKTLAVNSMHLRTQMACGIL